MAASCRKFSRGKAGPNLTQPHFNASRESRSGPASLCTPGLHAESTHMSTDNIAGDGEFRYRVSTNWARIPADLDFVEAIGVAVAPDDSVFVFNRGTPAVFVFRPDGSFVTSWGNDFVRPHGISFAPDGTLLLTDDLGHQIRRYSCDGELLANIGPAGSPSETGVDGFDYRTIQMAGPYNLPTNVAVADNGHLFVADGYGNAAVHHFNKHGDLLKSWGGSGDGPGQFNVPHGICVDRDRIIVADRENSRLQFFDHTGTLRDIWTGVVRPCQVLCHDTLYYVAELGNQNGLFPWQNRPEKPTGGRVSIFARDGQLLARLGGGTDPSVPAAFYACHDIAVDSKGNFYVGEVAVTASRAAGEDPAGLPTLRRFERT